MKKLLMVVGLLMVAAGCEQQVELKTENEVRYQIDRVGNCEYLQFYVAGNNYVLSHKGDCTNLIHRNLSAEAR